MVLEIEWGWAVWQSPGTPIRMLQVAGALPEKQVVAMEDLYARSRVFLEVLAAAPNILHQL